MNALDYKILRDGVLLSVAPAGDTGLSVEAIGRHCHMRGFCLEDQQLAAQLDYLIGKGLLCESTALLSAGFKCYVLSGAGQMYLEAERLL